MSIFTWLFTWYDQNIILMKQSINCFIESQHNRKSKNKVNWCLLNCLFFIQKEFNSNVLSVSTVNNKSVYTSKITGIWSNKTPVLKGSVTTLSFLFIAPLLPVLFSLEIVTNFSASNKTRLFIFSDTYTGPFWWRIK